eukprot:IDg18790t1
MRGPEGPPSRNKGAPRPRYLPQNVRKVAGECRHKVRSGRGTGDQQCAQFGAADSVKL